MESQVRKHLKFKFIHRIRSIFLRRKLGFLGKDVFLDKNVKIMRFRKNINIAEQVIIKEGAKICSCNEAAKIYIGKRTTIGYYSFIFSSEYISIGDDCLIAPFVYIVDSNHGIKKQFKINQQANITKPIVVGDDVWIGSNVIILNGVKIGNGAVIAANSVVNRNIEPYEIFGGSPAKKIGERS